MTLDPRQTLSRRALLHFGLQAGVGALGAFAAGRLLTGCTAASPASAGSTAAKAGSLTEWATGGTAAMSGSYPDPFVGGAAAATTLTPELTVGPCYAATLFRRDISEGLGGLPVRLAFKVVDAQTGEPVPGVTVDVWHTNASGFYSAYPKGSMCNPDSSDAAEAHFFRGVQTADANGRVDFDTVYPGWYASRTVHIHYTVRLGDTKAVTSQLVFDDALTDRIYAEHPEYSARPKRDTTNQNDTVVRAAQLDQVVAATARLPDGALHVWKTIAIKR